MNNKVLALFLILTASTLLGACTGERTSRYFFKNVPMLSLASPSPSVLTAETDPDTKNGILPHEHLEENETIIDGVLLQNDLKLLYESMQVEEITLPLVDPQSAIPIRKIEKTIGRLSCFRQFPFINDEELMRLKTRHECHFVHSDSKPDRILYENLAIEEKESDGIFIKSSSLLECSKSIDPRDGSAAYLCKIISEN